MSLGVLGSNLVCWPAWRGAGSQLLRFKSSQRNYLVDKGETKDKDGSPAVDLQCSHPCLAAGMSSVVQVMILVEISIHQGLDVYCAQIKRLTR